LSSRLLTGEISRREALDELSIALYDPRKLRDDEEFIAKKLELGLDEFLAFKEIPLAHFSDFPNDSEKLALIQKKGRELRARLRKIPVFLRGRG